MDPSVLFCSDEDIAVRASGDFADLVPDDQVMAAGVDGVITSGSPWVLTSASASFVNAGVRPGMILLIDPETGITPQQLAVSQVAATSLTLRRKGTGSATSLGSGQPPTPGTGLDYSILTLLPQIEDATYDLNKWLGIDENFATKQAEYIYDQRAIRQATVLTVLVRQYTTMARTKDGDWSAKRDLACHDLEELKARLVVKWGPLGLGQPATTRFGARITR